MLMVNIEKKNEINNNPVNHQELPQPKEGRAFGHRFKIILEKMKVLFHDLFRSLSDAVSQRSPLGKIYKLNINILTAVGHVSGAAFRGAGLLKVLRIADNFNDCLDAVADVDHFVNKRYYEKLKEGDAIKAGDKIRQEDNKYKYNPVDEAKRGAKVQKGEEIYRINRSKLVASTAFLIADIVGMVLWLDELAIISLAKISASIGRGASKLAAVTHLDKFVNVAAKFFAPVSPQALMRTFPATAKIFAKITVVNTLRTIVAGAFLALTINEFVNLAGAIRERNIQKIVNSSIYIVSYVAEIALKILVIASCTSVPGLVAVGCIAAGFGLAGFVMEVVRKYMEERAKEKQAVVKPPIQAELMVAA